MPKCRYDGLLNEHFVADGAVAAFCKTGICASRCDCRIYDDRMPCRRELHISGGIASGAGIVCIPANRRASRCLRVVVDKVVPKCRQSRCFLLIRIQLNNNCIIFTG